MPQGNGYGVRLVLQQALAVSLVAAALSLGVRLAADIPQAIGDRSGGDVRLAIEAGRYAEAEERAFGLVSDLEQTPSAVPPELDRARGLLVEALVLNGKGARPSSVALAEQVLRSEEERSPLDGLRVSSARRNLGDVLFEAGDYPRSIASYERALALCEAGARGPCDLSDHLNRLARALIRTGRYDDARSHIDRSQQVVEGTPGPSDIRLARTLELKGRLLQRKGDYVGARPFLERAVAIREALAPSHPEMIGALSALGAQLLFEGKLTDARDCLQRAVETATARLRPGHPDIAFSLRQLASAIADLGDLSEARSLRERAASVAEAAFGPEHPQLAGFLNDLANAQVAQGDYAAARTLYERSLAIRERSLGPNHLDVATAAFNLSNFYRILGDFEEARRFHNRAVSIWKATLGAEHPFVGFAFYSWGESLAEFGQYDQARLSLERALMIRERSLGPDHPDVADTLQELAAVLLHAGLPDRAAQALSRAFGIWARTGVHDSQLVAAALRTRATLHAERREYRDARVDFERALEIKRRIVGEGHPQYAELQIELAAVLARLGDPSALNRALRAEDVARGHLRLTLRYLPERESLAYAAKRAWGFDLALSLPRTADAATGMFDAVIRGRALVADEMATRRHTAAGRPDSDIAPLWSALASARQRQANLVVRGPSGQHPEQYAALLEDARRQKEAAERALAARSAAFKAELESVDIGVQQIRAALPSRSALVSFVRYDRTIFDHAVVPRSVPTGADPREPHGVPSYVAFVTRADDDDVAAIPIGGANEIDTLVARWRDAVIVGAAHDAAAGSGEDSSRALGARLRKRVWDPMGDKLVGVTTVFVVPDGSLSLVTWAALPIGRTQYLIDRGPVIHYLSAERDLVASQDGSASAAGTGLLAVGGPAFDDRGSSATGSPRRAIAIPSTLRGAPSTCVSLHSLQFPGLPASLREAREVARLWAGANGDDAGTSTLLLGRAADERTFKEQASHRRVLHLATHGFFLGGDCQPAIAGTRSIGGLATRRRPAANGGASENPLLLAGLAFAGANRRSVSRASDDDGILTGEEVAALNLEGVEWAVLSACDTGLGEIKAGEGVFGLRRAFQIAGARTVIMSLWSVDDHAALLWMRALYEGRLQKHLSTADAMHDASVRVLRARRASGQSTLPFYWAGFVAAGDWR